MTVKDDTVVHVWKVINIVITFENAQKQGGHEQGGWKEEMARVTGKGLKTILSSPWLALICNCYMFLHAALGCMFSSDPSFCHHFAQVSELHQLWDGLEEILSGGASRHRLNYHYYHYYYYYYYHYY